MGDILFKALTAVLLGVLLSLGGGVAAHAAQGLQIFVSLPSGGVPVTIDADSSDSIENIKQKIQDKTLILPSEQSLSYAGTPLVDGHTLADYNIQDGASVLLGYVTALALTSPAFPPFSLAADYTATIAAGPAFSPLTFTLTAGALPAGVTFDPATGIFAGRPTTAGPYAFTITATRDDGTTLAVPFAGSIAAAAVPAAPGDSLVETGVDPMLPLGFAALLLLAGSALLVRTRRA